MKQLLIYVRTLDFDECPDYDEIIKVFDIVYKDLSGATESAYEIEATESAYEIEGFADK